MIAAAVLAAAGCGGRPKDDVISREASTAAWTANGRIAYWEELTPSKVDVKLHVPSSGKDELVGEFFGDPTFLDADDTDRLLLGGIGGAYSLIRHDGTVLYEVTVLAGASGGYEVLHLAASGTKLALATLPPQPDLQIHDVTDGSVIDAFTNFEGTTEIRELDWSPDDQLVYYVKGDATGAAPDAIRSVDAETGLSPQTIFQDPFVPFIDRIFLSNDGEMFVISGRDDDGETGVWMLPAAGGLATRVAREDERRLAVRAASGASPDGGYFVMHATTARGTFLTVERLEPLE